MLPPDSRRVGVARPADCVPRTSKRSITVRACACAAARFITPPNHIEFAKVGVA